MPEKTIELRNEAAELRRMAELPANASIRGRMLALAAKYDEIADDREGLGSAPGRDQDAAD